MSSIGNYEVVINTVSLANNSATQINPPADKVALSVNLLNTYTDFYSRVNLDGSVSIYGTGSSSTPKTVGYSIVWASMGTC